MPINKKGRITNNNGQGGLPRKVASKHVHRKNGKSDADRVARLKAQQKDPAYAYRNKASPEIEEIGKSLLEWVKRPSALCFEDFCAKLGYPIKCLKLWALRSEVFAEDFALARACIAGKLKKKIFLDMTSAQTLKLLHQYDDDYREWEREFRLSGKSEDKEVKFVIETPEFLRKKSDERGESKA